MRAAERNVVDFAGPFSWPGTDLAPSIFTADVGRKSGVYLWTVRLDHGELVYYVGQTGRSFARRMLEHYREHTSGGYHLYEPEEFSRGRKVPLWSGLYGPGREESIMVFMRRFGEFAQVIADLAFVYRFWVAPLSCEGRLRERIEAAIANHLYAQPGAVGEFQDRGIRYHARYSDEEPVQIAIRCAAHLIGLPDTLWV